MSYEVTGISERNKNEKHLSSLFFPSALSYYLDSLYFIKHYLIYS